MPKNTQTRENLKVIQSFIHPYIFLQYSEDVGKGLCIFTFTFRSSLVCVLFGKPSLYLFWFFFLVSVLFSTICCEV